MLACRVVLADMVKSHTEMCGQNHPFHIGSVWQHTELVVEWCRRNDPRLIKIALVHDVGKPAVKGEKNGQDTFYKHAKASVEWCQENGIELNELETDLILEHDNAKSWENGKKLESYITKHGDVFCELLSNLITADAAGQSRAASINNEIITKIRNNSW